MSDNHDKAEVLKITTSGSTGEPFVCFVDRAQLEFRWAATFRAWSGPGGSFGDRQLRLWHQTIGMSKTQVVREFADAMLSRRKFIPAYEMCDETLASSSGPSKVRAGAARWLRRVVQLPRPVLARARRDEDVAQGDYLLGADAARGIAQAHRGGIRLQSVRQIRLARVLGNRLRVRGALGHHVVGEGYIVEILKDGGRRSRARSARS